MLCHPMPSLGPLGLEHSLMRNVAVHRIDSQTAKPFVGMRSTHWPLLNVQWEPSGVAVKLPCWSELSDYHLYHHFQFIIVFLYPKGSVLSYVVGHAAIQGDPSIIGFSIRPSRPKKSDWVAIPKTAWRWVDSRSILTMPRAANHGQTDDAGCNLPWKKLVLCFSSNERKMRMKCYGNGWS